MENKNRSFEWIETDRLHMKHITKKYAHDIFNEKNKHEVNQYLASKSASDIAQLLHRIDSVTIDNNNKDIIQLETSRKDDDSFIGLCGIKKPYTPHPEIWLWLKQSAWGQWYGKELVAWLVKRIKENLTYEYIIYETFEKNIGSVKIIEWLWWVKDHDELKENYFWEKMKHVQYRIYYIDQLYNNLSETK